MSITAQRPQWLPSEGPGNLNVPPEKWGMKLSQWAAFLTSCMITKLWVELENSTDRKEAGYVNLYQICDNFVKPWTKGTGNSIALLMNATEPLKAQVMISHAWGESIIETLTALLGKCFVLGMPHDTPIWFCTFAQYQPGDEENDCGPTVAQQIALDPFKKVIMSNPPWGMLVVHTSRAELYGRLWCVYEVNEAEDSSVRASAALSLYYGILNYRKVKGTEAGMAALRVNTHKADCWSPSDARMIRSIVENAGGFDKLDEKIFNFRSHSYTLTQDFYESFVDWFQQGFGASAEEGMELILGATRNSARIIGLHYLTLIAQAAQDQTTGEEILENAREVCKFFNADKFMIPPEAGPPPRFDAGLLDAPDFPWGPQGDDELLDLLLADPHQKDPPTFLAWAVGTLLMSCGGIADPDACAQQYANLKAQFHNWDQDGSGTITKAELAGVLMKLNPEFTEEDMDALFAAADANRDGLIDYEEFVDWLSQGQ